jgi:phthiocerol/phenolphthiocerol synthesis type-I polyketide synthase C
MTAASSDRRAIITEALRKIDDLTARLEIAEKGHTEPIAVVGMGCRFPGGVNNSAEYWQLLLDGASGVVRVPSERWDADAFFTEDHTVPGTICNREGGFLTSWKPDEFDAEFFGIPPVRRPEWTRNSGCFSRSLGRRWKTQESPPARSAAPRPRSSLV